MAHQADVEHLALAFHELYQGKGGKMPPHRRRRHTPPPHHHHRKIK